MELQRPLFGEGHCQVLLLELKTIMSLESLLQDDYWEVYIQWTRPCLYERVRDEGSKYDNSAHLYYIRAKYSTGRSKVLYIGQTYQQSVSIRLGQPDHRKRYAEFTNSYPNHRFAVSHGIVSITYGNITLSFLSNDTFQHAIDYVRARGNSMK